VYVDGIVLKRSWVGEVRNVSLLVSIGVNGEAYREILGICEDAKEDKASWSGLRGLKGRPAPYGPHLQQFDPHMAFSLVETKRIHRGHFQDSGSSRSCTRRD